MIIAYSMKMLNTPLAIDVLKQCAMPCPLILPAPERPILFIVPHILAAARAAAVKYQTLPAPERPIPSFYCATHFSSS